MRFILRKYIDAETAEEALQKDSSTPVHDVYLKEGEEPKRTKGGSASAVGFTVDAGFFEQGVPTSKGR